MEEFLSEPITPVGAFDTAAMARGLPGLPQSVRWREQVFEVATALGTWKQSAPEGGRAGGELYLRRHYFRLRMSDGAIWTVYFTRQPLRGRRRTTTGRTAAAQRWFLYSREPACDDSVPGALGESTE